MTTKTIWFVSKYYASPPNDGSGSTRVFFTMRELTKLGQNVVIFTSGTDPYSELNTTHDTTESRLVDGVKVWLLRGLKYKSSISLSRIFSWLHFEYVLFRDFRMETSKPDVVIISSPSILTIFNGLYFKRKYKTKLIFEVRDIWPLTLVEDAGMSRFNPFIMLMGMIEKIAYKYSNGIVGTMPNLKQHVKKILGYDKKVGFAPMGISSENFQTPKPLEASYIETHIPKNKFLIVYAGTIGVANALETLFACASSLAPDKDIHFLLVGDGPLLNKYKKDYAHLTNLTFAPKIKKSQVQSLLTYADLLYFSVANSEVWEYGQSLNKIIDYMVAAKPIIASYSGFPSMLDESGCGIFIPVDNIALLTKEITRIKNLPTNERMAMGQKGKEWLLNNRNYETLAKNYLNYIQEI
jgi:glycosyltransferase involved in cell wall biosynthesis